MTSNINSSESEWNYSESDIAQKFLFFNVLKDGRIHVLLSPSEKVPPSFGSFAGVSIKDIEISPDVSARIFLPSSSLASTCTTNKLPVVFYLRGGGFCMRSAFNEEYTIFGSYIAAEANAVVVSVEYGLFPARPLPACYDDSWTALQWLVSHKNASGPESPDSWINDYADLRRIFVCGNSAGGNICHTLLAKVGSIELPGEAKIGGMILIHPYFGDGDKMWMYMCPTNTGPKDPRMKPAAEDLAKTGCDRVLVVLAENDELHSAGKMYAEELIKSGWKGRVEIMENKGKGHSFHLSNQMDPEAIAIRQRITSFIHLQEWNYSESDIAQKFLFFNVLKDGRIHVSCPPYNTVPPSFGSSLGVIIKDVEISSDISARIFCPSSTTNSPYTTDKLPVLLYIHGGGFCRRTAISEEYTRFCSYISAEANVLVVSIDYGLFPKRPIPACYDDSWTALQWVVSHVNGSGPEQWINDYGDLGRIFVGGDSAGGNISHTLLAKVGSVGLNGGAKVEGMIMIHSYFGEDDKMWMYMCPTNQGPQDPRMKPAVADLAKTGCDRVLVFLAEKDGLYGAGKMYANELVKSGWKGKLEVIENKEKDHCFHLHDHNDVEAVAIRHWIASFIHNQG